MDVKILPIIEKINFGQLPKKQQPGLIALHSNTKKQNTISVTAPLALVSFCSNKSYSKSITSPNGTYIIPKEFLPQDPKALTLCEEYPKGKNYPFFDCDDATLTKEANSQELQLVAPDSNEVICISNFDEPYGTIAGSSTLDKTLYTEGLIQCAAMTVVDKANNTQSLIHVYPGYGKEDNKKIIGHILSSAEPDNLEISIIPGVDQATKSTIQFIIDTIKELAPDVSPKMYRFPNNEKLKISKRGLILHNGSLFCCDSDSVQNKIINPKENITYCKYRKMEYVKAEEIQDILRNTPLPKEYNERAFRNWAIDNKLKFETNNNGYSSLFEDVDGKTVRIIMADLNDKKQVSLDIRYLYDKNGNIVEIKKLKNI